MTNAPLTPGPPNAAQVYSEVRANIVFENMVAAVLIGAAACGAVLFAAKNAILVSKGVWSLAALLSTTMGAIYFTFLAFLIGFLSAVVVAMPLFLALERMKMRKVWPFVVAAFAVEYCLLWLIFGRIPTLDEPSVLFYLAPGLVMALLFGRRMGPIWRAAERAETQSMIYRVR